VGRRVVLGMLGLGVAGVLGGARAQGGVERLLSGVENKDRLGLTSLLPAAGGFRYYSVTGGSPRRSAATYRLVLGGLVERPRTLSLADLQAMPSTSLTRDFQCVTGWRVADVPWQGVLLRDLLDAVRVRPEARALRLRSFDGAYTESLTIEQARRDDVLVALRMQGRAVTRAHGGPVRLYAAPMYGYKSIKWLSSIEATRSVVPGFWERRGYDVDAWIGRSNGRDDPGV